MNKTIILVSGKMRSGKNTFVDFMMKDLTDNGVKCGYDYFAKDLKNYAKEDFSSIVSYLNHMALSYDIPELMTREENWYENKNSVTRILLQTYGTEIIRKRVSEKYWVEKVLERIKKSDNEVIFISDVRFPSEVNDIIELRYTEGYNVITCRVDRKKAVGEGVQHGTTEHPSETALDDYSEWIWRIDNDGTLDDLNETAKMFSSSIRNQ